MKRTGFLFRIIPVLLAAVLLVGALPAAAAEPEAQPAVELTAAREGSQISVKIKTLSQIGIDGMTFSFDYDSSAFAFSEVVSDWFGDPAVNENEKLVMLTSGSSETFPAGTVLAELKFSTGDAYVMGNEYTFTVTFSEVVDADLNGYDWQTAAISAVLKEAASHWGAI